MGAVADDVCLTRASDTTRLIDRLAKAGLAERLPNPNDRRGVLVRATGAGRRVFADGHPADQEFHRPPVVQPVGPPRWNPAAALARQGAVGRRMILGSLQAVAHRPRNSCCNSYRRAYGTPCTRQLETRLPRRRGARYPASLTPFFGDVIGLVPGEPTPAGDLTWRDDDRAQPA